MRVFNEISPYEDVSLLSQLVGEGELLVVRESEVGGVARVKMISAEGHGLVLFAGYNHGHRSGYR